MSKRSCTPQQPRRWPRSQQTAPPATEKSAAASNRAQAAAGTMILGLFAIPLSIAGLGGVWQALMTTLIPHRGGHLDAVEYVLLGILFMMLLVQILLLRLQVSADGSGLASREGRAASPGLPCDGPG